MSNDENRLSHRVWECKYHIVWIPKYRRKALYGELRECKIIEGHVCIDHVHMLISIPPKYSVSQVVGFIKGKSAISIARNFMGKKRDFTGQNFWAQGYHVSTVGRDEEAIKKYIQQQEKEDQRLDQLRLF